MRGALVNGVTIMSDPDTIEHFGAIIDCTTDAHIGTLYRTPWNIRTYYYVRYHADGPGGALINVGTYADIMNDPAEAFGCDVFILPEHWSELDKLTLWLQRGVIQRRRRQLLKRLG